MSFEILVPIAASVLAVAVAVAGWLAYERRQSVSVRGQKGPEDAPSIGRDGDLAEAQPEVLPAPEPVDLPAIRPLSRAANHHFSEEWASVQAMFADDPAKAVEQADGLAGDVLRACGYSVADVVLGAPARAMPHPRVVERYRAAHAIATAVRASDGARDADAGRRAFVHYHPLFADLLKAPAHPPTAQPLPRPRRAS